MFISRAALPRAQRDGMGRTRANGQRWYCAYFPNGMAGGATSPLIPLYTARLGGSVADVGIVGAAPSVASVPAFLLWGALADRLRLRKAFLILGFLGLAVSLFAMVFVRDLRQLYLANLLMGFLSSASAPVGAILVMESADREDWPARLAAFSRMGGVGWILGLALGAAWLGGVGPFVGEDAMRSLLAVAGGLAALSALLAWRWVEEPRTTLDRFHVRDVIDLHWTVERLRFLPLRLLHYVDLRNHRGRLSRGQRAYLAAVFLLFSGFTAFYAFFPIFLTDVAHLSNAQVFLTYIASQAASAAAYPRVGRWIRDRGSRRMQAMGATARAILFPAFFALPLLPLGAPALFAVILGLHAMVGLCWSVINVSGSLLASELATAEARGRALGAYNAVQGFGSIAGPLVGGLLAHLAGYSAGFAIASAFILAGVAALGLVRVAEESPVNRAGIPASPG